MLTPQQLGMTLIELLLALVLTGLLMIGLVHFASAAGSSNRLMENQALLHDQLRIARRTLAPAIMQAGYNPHPWNTGLSLAALGDETADSSSDGNDRLVVRAWSDRNCFVNLNPVKDTKGNPAFHIRETSFDVSSSKHLTRECSYGPGLTDMTVQIRRQGLIPGVESFQLMFGEDRDANGNVDLWVRGGEWSSKQGVKGVKVGLLLAGSDRVVEPAPNSFQVLDRSRSTRADGKLRMNIEFTFAIRGKGR